MIQQILYTCENLTSFAFMKQEDEGEKRTSMRSIAPRTSSRSSNKSWYDDVDDDDDRRMSKSSMGKLEKKWRDRADKIKIGDYPSFNEQSSKDQQRPKGKGRSRNEKRLDRFVDEEGLAITPAEKKRFLAYQEQMRRKREMRRLRRARCCNCWSWCWDYDDDLDDEDAGFDTESSDETDDDYNEEEIRNLKPAIRTWLRLLFITLGASLVAGLVPGQALFIRMLSDFGIYGSLCEEGQLSCVDSSLSVAASFNLVQGFSYLSTLPAGYLFDRLGGRVLAVLSALSTFLGVLLMEVPLLGVQYGYDKITCKVFPVALVLTDVGAMCSQYCVLSMVYHFPNSQMLLLSLIIAQQQLCAILPNLVQQVQAMLQIDLPVAFALLSASTFAAAVELFLIVPTKKEYLKQARRITGARPPKSDGLWTDIKMVTRNMRVYCADHVYFVMAMVGFFTQLIVYQSLLGVYVQLLWGTQKAGDDMASLMTVLQSTLGTSSCLVISMISDRFGQYGIYVLAVVSAVLLMLTTLSVLSPAYISQLICVLCNVVLFCVTGPLAMKYCVTYCVPSQLGSFNGVIWTFIVIGYTVVMGVFLGYATEATTAPQLGFLIFVTQAGSTLFFMVWFVRQMIRGLPRKPPQPWEDMNATLMKPFL